MTDRNDTTDPIAEPTVTVFPLTLFRQKLTTLSNDDLNRLVAKLNLIRMQLGKIAPDDLKGQRLAQAQRVLSEYIQTRYTPPLNPTAVDDGLAAINQVQNG